MAVIIIPPNSFTESINHRVSLDSYKIIDMIEMIRKWDFQLLFYISQYDWYILKKESQFRELQYYLHSGLQIPFIIYSKDMKCDEELLIDNTVAHYNFKNLFLSIINYQFQVPLIASDSQNQLLKLSCDGCSNNSEYCKNGFELVFPPLTSLDFDTLLKRIQDLNLDNQLVNNYEFDRDAINSFLYYIFEIIGVEKLASQIDSIDYCDSFIRDINNFKEDKMRILLSLARMVGFPPVQDPSRSHKYSIDWHPNTKRTIKVNNKNYALFRCDVVDGLSDRGLSHSGAKRVLFATNNHKRILISYTDQHDFSETFIKSCLEEYYRS